MHSLESEARTERKCKSCDYVGTFRRIERDGSRDEVEGALVCRRYPPTTAVVPPARPNSTSTIFYIWPNVHEDARCGEYKPKGAWNV